MTKMLFVVSFGVFCLVPFSSCLSVYTRLPIGIPEENQSILDFEHMTRWSDTAVKLTAVKDMKRQSCFINDYDPRWNPNESDKDELINTLVYEIVDSNEDEYNLRKIAGNTISQMCKPVRIYWATLPPPPMLNPGGVDNNMLPPPAMPNQDNMKIPPSLAEFNSQDRNEIVLEPQNINTDDGLQSQSIKIPPPLDIYQQQHQQHIENRRYHSEDVDGSMMEPPPLQRGGPAEAPKFPPPIETFAKEDLLGPPPMRIQPETETETKEDLLGQPPMRIQPETETETKEDLLGPPPMRIQPETETDDAIAPPPINVWRRMLASIKKDSTLAPPTPDMRSPEFKAFK